MKLTSQPTYLGVNKSEFHTVLYSVIVVGATSSLHWQQLAEKKTMFY